MRVCCHIITTSGKRQKKKGEVGIVDAYPQEKEAEKGGRTDADA